MSEVMSEVRPYTPNQIYTFDLHKRVNTYNGGRTTPAAQLAAEKLKQINSEFINDHAGHYQKVLDGYREPLSQDAPPYLIYKDRDCSADTALVIGIPYANPIKPTASPEKTADIVATDGWHPFYQNNWHQAEKHYFLLQMMKELGVRDEAGKTIPVIAVASPSKDWQPNFSKDQRALLKEGDFTPFVPWWEQILEHEGFGQTHIGGWSLCSGIGQAALHGLTNIDVLSGSFGEPLNYKDRTRWETFKNYVLNKPSRQAQTDLKSPEKWTVDGPLSRYIMEGSKPANIWQHNLLLQGPVNAWLLWGAMGKPSLFDNLQKAADKELVPVTLEYGQTSAMTHDFEDYLNTDNQVLERYKQARKLRLVKAVGHEAVGAPHLHGESPMFYALWLAESVLWATERNRS